MAHEANSLISLLGGNASSSAYYAGNPPNNAFDGNSSTYWLADSNSSFLEWTLPSNAILTSYIININTTGSGNKPISWVLYGLDASDAQTAIDSKKNYNWSQAKVTFTISNPTSFRKFKLAISQTSYGSGTYAAVYEFDIVGTPSTKRRSRTI